MSRKGKLPEDRGLQLDLTEDGIISDPSRAYQRTARDDGIIYDLSTYDEFGLIVAYVPLDDGAVFRFVDFNFRDWSADGGGRGHVSSAR